MWKSLLLGLLVSLHTRIFLVFMRNYEAKSPLFMIKRAGLNYVPRQSYSKNSHGSYILKWILDSCHKMSLTFKAILPQKKSVFVKKFEIEINAWEDSPSFALSATLWFFIWRPFFDEVFNRFLSSNVEKRHFFLEKECFEVFARNFR